jgi:hypothetical protein
MAAMPNAEGALKNKPNKSNFKSDALTSLTPFEFFF